MDLHPWETAQSLAALAVTIEEGEYAREAERLADHEVDQAFASALRQAIAKHRSLTGEALNLSRKLIRLQQTVEEDRAHLQSLTQAATPLLHRQDAGLRLSRGQTISTLPKRSLASTRMNWPTRSRS